MARFVFVDFASEERYFVTDAFEFCQRIHLFAKENVQDGTSALWFRGQAKEEWDLIPSVGRKQNLAPRFRDLSSVNLAKELPDHERVLLQRFKRDGYPFTKRALTDWEALTLGQHHFLATRLLDWSSNPLVALFFAVESHYKENDDPANASIFAYRPRKGWNHHISMFPGQNPKKAEVPDPIRQDGIKMVFPILLADRLVAQAGGFTIQNPLKCLMTRQMENFEESELDIRQLFRWKLPLEKKEHILDQLHRCSINRRTLFPGLDGLGVTLISQEQFRTVPGGFVSTPLT